MLETFTWAASYTTSLDRKPRILECVFGDGYAQRMGDGINNVPELWSVVFSEREETEIAAIDAFLRGRGGHESFYWTAPAGTEKIYVCKEWNARYTAKRNSSLTATFLQSFTLET